MNITERVLQFECAGEPMLGLVSLPEEAAVGAPGVLIVVGGPQYRVGSHRQFVLLARRLAEQGYPAMRFDARGMGDSGGAARGFESIGDDIAAAAAAFRLACPSLDSLVLWGICDAASAILLYCRDRPDARISGLCLLNPWVRSAESLAKAQVKHYYWRRLTDRDFWAKLLGGRVAVGAALRELLAKIRVAAGPATADAGAVSTVPFPTRMAQGLRGFGGPVLLIVSGGDLTAREFLDHAGSDYAWAGLLKSPGLHRCDIVDADHTFSTAGHRRQVENTLLEWLRRLENA